MATPPATPTSGSANTSTLSEWAGPYVTDMLAKGQALSNAPYQTYGGPLTAGASTLQNKVSAGLGSLSFPGNFGKSFNATGAPTIGPDGQPIAGAGDPSMAAQYMNPYLQSVLNPQLDELRRQSQITQNQNAGKMASAGAFGGGRQAIMDAETQRNLMQEQNKTVGTGYANAYDKAMGQFNTEQNQSKTLADMMAEQGKVDRGIESEGVAADLNEFNAQRDNPQQQVKFLNSLLQGLPISTVANVPQGQTDMQQFTGNMRDIQKLLKDLKLIP